MNLYVVPREDIGTRRSRATFRSCLSWVLGTELLSSKRTQNTLNWWAVSPEPQMFFLMNTIIRNHYSFTIIITSSYNTLIRFISSLNSLLITGMPLCLCAGMCMWGQVPREARVVRSYGAGVTGFYEVIYVGPGNWILVLWKSYYMLLTPETTHSFFKKMIQPFCIFFLFNS